MLILRSRYSFLPFQVTIAEVINFEGDTSFPFVDA
jgi:hypothetical protein